MDLAGWRWPWAQQTVEERLSLNDVLSMFQYGGLNYALTGGGTPNSNQEPVENSFSGYVNGAYKSDGIIFACIAARQLLFSEARFQYRRMTLGRPGDLFGTADLQVLEKPWIGATTGDLLTRTILDADLAGNAYAIRKGNRIIRLRPDWTTIVLGSKTGSELDMEVIGYAYEPGGPQGDEDPVMLDASVVSHFAPYPDPEAKFRGMSWLTPVLEEIVADKATISHKRNFFENGAKLGYVVTLDKDMVMSPEKFESWTKVFKSGHEGALNAYKTLFLAGGADVKTVGVDMKQVDFKQVQGAGETRICAAARVPPIIVGVSEGLEAATYSNYGQARRAFADLTMRPLWRNMAGSFAKLVNVPGGADLWYDDRDISFLQEDEKDDAEIQQMQAGTIASLVREGFTSDSAVAAVTNGDMTMLKHTGMFSVQLQPPGASEPAVSPVNGNGNGQPLLPASTS